MFSKHPFSEQAVGFVDVRYHPADSTDQRYTFRSYEVGRCAVRQQLKSNAVSPIGLFV
jgi:hypothetical protein